MNAREKVLVVLLGIAIAAFVGRTMVRRYTNALDEYDNRIEKLNKELNKIDLECEKAAIARTDWVQFGSQTLSMDVNEAATRLRDELNTLAEKANLQEIAVTLSGRPSPWGNKTGLQVLNCSVKAEGELDDILKFFFNLHIQPYAVRCKTLSMSQTLRGSQRSRKGNKDTGLLKISAQLDTLILPANKMVAQITPAVLEKNQRKNEIRPMLANISEYNPLLNKRLFKPYEPPPPPPIRDRRQSRKTVEQKPEKKPEPPPEDAHMVVRGLLSSPRGQLTVLEKPGKQDEADVYKEIGDKMFGGTLIFVHPKGAVTEKDGERRFHAIGQELQDFMPLTEENQPVIYHELLKLENRSAGISQGAG